MKRRYERPSAYIEEFTPNEYVAACGDKGTVYKFKCDAGGGHSGRVWLETNGEPGLQKEGRWEGWKGWDDWGEYHPGDKKLGGYYACGTTHNANSKDGFSDGYYIMDGSNSAQNVIVWRGPKGDNIHCTTNLDINSWETAKS